jgi:hypothetical protein
MYLLVYFFGIVILENDHQYLGMNLWACHSYSSTSCIHYGVHPIHTFLLGIDFNFIMFCLPSYSPTLVIHCGVQYWVQT